MHCLGKYLLMSQPYCIFKMDYCILPYTLPFGMPIIWVPCSTCHWCHVMERESFESNAVADILNEKFVSIKVDREERPDVDRVYVGPLLPSISIICGCVDTGVVTPQTTVQSPGLFCNSILLSSFGICHLEWMVGLSISLSTNQMPDVYFTPSCLQMTYIQAISGGGGWPMSVFLTPTLDPIVGMSSLWSATSVSFFLLEFTCTSTNFEAQL